jgi:hypothetical protein
MTTPTSTNKIVLTNINSMFNPKPTVSLKVESSTIRPLQIRIIFVINAVLTEPTVPTDIHYMNVT